MRESPALCRQPPGTPDWAACAGKARPATAAELPAGYAYGLRYAVPLAEMPLYLPWLVAQLRERGGEIRARRVSSLGERPGGPADALVNCPGLAARGLPGDLTVYPVRGQIVRVTHPGLTRPVRDEHHPGGRACVHPRTQDCILGGTLQEHSRDTRAGLATAEAIIARCTQIVPDLAGASVIGHIAGLRPGRPAARLEEPRWHPRRPRHAQLRSPRSGYHPQPGLRRRRYQDPAPPQRAGPRAEQQPDTARAETSPTRTLMPLPACTRK
jgi:D-amino-acid oxidase